MTLLRTLPTRSRALLLVLLGLVAAIGMLFVSVGPAKANVLSCGSGQNSVVQSNYHGYFYLTVGCYPKPILMAYGDSVVYPASAGGSIRIDPRVECQLHLWGHGYFYEANYSYSYSIGVTTDVDTTEYVDYCWAI